MGYTLRSRKDGGVVFYGGRVVCSLGGGSCIDVKLGVSIEWRRGFFLYSRFWKLSRDVFFYNKG